MCLLIKFKNMRITEDQNLMLWIFLIGFLVEELRLIIKHFIELFLSQLKQFLKGEIRTRIHFFIHC